MAESSPNSQRPPGDGPLPPASEEEQIIDFGPDVWDQHKGKIIALLVVAILTAIGIAWWQAAEATGRASAAASFAAAKTAMEFEAVALKHPNSPLAAEALILASDLLAAESKLDEARVHLDQFLTKYPTHPLASGAQLKRAMLSERQGDVPRAIMELRTLLAELPKSYAAPIASLNLIRLLQTHGKSEEAASVLQRFGASHTGSVFLPEAEMEMRFAKASGKPEQPKPVKVIQEQNGTTALPLAVPTPEPFSLAPSQP